MFSQNHYLIRSKQDGKHLSANPHQDTDETSMGYLLMFREDFDARSYLNKYAGDLADRFAVESVSNTQLKSLLKRWGYLGIGLVEDPLIPRIKFLNVK